MKYQLGFIGCGNMGNALIRAAAQTVECDRIAVCDHNQQKTETLVYDLGVHALSAQEIATEAEFVILGVKPQVMKETVSTIAEELRARKNVTLVTMAAGLTISSIRSFVGKNVPVIRIMPNTPVSLGVGMILYATDAVSRETEEKFLTAFSKAGVFDKLPEEQIDAGCALSGCGPAFVYAFAQALADGGVKCGLSQEKAALYAAQTLRGAADMLLKYGDPEALKGAVCSKGGATIEGVHHLEKNDLHGVTVGAVQSAYRRTLELKK